MTITRPFLDGGQVWRDQGYPNTLPLPPQRKKYPPKGYTGHAGVSPTEQDIERWNRTRKNGNLAIRLELGLCGLDVDAYKPEGKASFDHLLKKCGPLPPTWVSTSRSDGVSGIRLYRIPVGVELKGAPMPGIEIVQFHHRYVIVRPSIHTSGDTYQLLSPDGERVDSPPQPGELPELPKAWLHELIEHKTPVGQRKERTRPSGEPAKVVAEALGKALMDLGHQGGRHDASTGNVLTLVRYADLGYPGADDALHSLRSSFTSAISDRANPKEAEKEWDDLVSSAEAKVRSEPASAPTWDELERRREDKEARRGATTAQPRPDPGPEVLAEVVTLQQPAADDNLELHDDGLWGIAGDWVRLVQQHTPAPPGPLLLQFLAIAGAYYGPRAWVQVGGTRHYPRMYVGIVGLTATGRKGDGLAIVENLWRRVDTDFVDAQIVSGVSSGEGLIARLADPVPDPVTGLTLKPTPDKRLVVREAELARVLAQSKREGNITSAVLRDAWDRHGDLAVLTRNEPLNAKGTHIALLGHITPMELSARTSDLDAANGLLNRFIWVWSEETRRMPRPPSLDKVVGPELDAIAGFIQQTFEGPAGGQFEFTPEAARMWDDEVYGAFTGTGVIQSLMARSDPYMLRLALIYALLDNAKAIDCDHLRAAMAVGRYWLAGVKRQWGNGLTEDGNKLLTLCREVRGLGVSVRRHRALLSGHADAKELERQRAELVRAGLGVVGQVKTSGRPATVVWAVEHAPEQYLPDGRAFVSEPVTKVPESRTS